MGILGSFARADAPVGGGFAPRLIAALRLVKLVEQHAVGCAPPAFATGGIIACALGQGTKRGEGHVRRSEAATD